MKKKTNPSHLPLMSVTFSKSRISPKKMSTIFFRHFFSINSQKEKRSTIFFRTILRGVLKIPYFSDFYARFARKYRHFCHFRRTRPPHRHFVRPPSSPLKQWRHLWKLPNVNSSLLKLKLKPQGNIKVNLNINSLEAGLEVELKLKPGQRESNIYRWKRTNCPPLLTPPPP